MIRENNIVNRVKSIRAIDVVTAQKLNLNHGQKLCKHCCESVVKRAHMLKICKQILLLLFVIVPLK